MTHHQIHLIRTTWRAASTIPQVGNLFYGRLFAIAPEVQPMFSRTTTTEQSMKLLAMLSYIIHKLDKLEDIIDEVAKLAKRHVGYGVEEKHYAYVGAALLWTLEKGLGDLWDEEVKMAWATCYEILSSAMMNATTYSEQVA